MKKITNIIIWALLLFLITPTTMALASWNAVPGDSTYPWKLSLEKVLLMFMSPSGKLASTTQVKIAERRFGELEQTLSGEYAFESLDNLEKQLDTTTSNIQKMDKEESRDQVKAQYIASLKKMSASLDEQKSQVVTGKTKAVAQKNTNKKPAPSNNPTTQPTNNNQNNNNQPTNNNSNPVSKPTSAPNNNPTPPPAVAPSDEELIEEIEETQDKIEQEIIKVETASTTTNNNNKNKNKDDDEEEEEKKPKWKKPEPEVPNTSKASTGNVSLPKSEKDNDTLAPATGQRSGSANWREIKIDMD